MNVVITGGASGLGEAITRKLAQDAGNTIYFTYSRSEEKARQLEQELNNVRSCKCDFRDEEQVKLLLGKLPGWNIDVLVNNAYSGSFIDTYFHKTEPTGFLTEFKNNILPTLSITQAALQLFRKKKSGKIITVLTAALVNTPPVGASAYVANKAYLEEMVKVWATENNRFNISSNAVSPAFMPTDFTKSIDERLVEQMLEAHPLKKFITPAEVAEAVAYLAAASAQVNGINMILNAGASLR
jgi:3-oxoacyl-[acyl-carrier protein] reductase